VCLLCCYAARFGEARAGTNTTLSSSVQCAVQVIARDHSAQQRGAQQRGNSYGKPGIKKIVYSLRQRCMLDSHNYNKIEIQVRRQKHNNIVKGTPGLTISNGK